MTRPKMDGVGGNWMKKRVFFFFCIIIFLVVQARTLFYVAYAPEAEDVYAEENNSDIQAERKVRRQVRNLAKRTNEENESSIASAILND